VSSLAAPWAGRFAYSILTRTTLSIKGISAPVHLGTWKTANAKLYRYMRQDSASGAGEALRDM
jgi:hypothetical protein